MDIQSVVTAVALITGIFGIHRAWREVQQLQDNRLRSDFQFVKDYVEAVQKGAHPLVIESGFRAVHRDSNLTAPEIVYLLGFEQPSKAVRFFVRGRMYLQFVAGVPGGHPSIGFEPGYLSEGKRKWLKRWYFCTYFGLAILAITPVLWPTQLFGANFMVALLALAVSLPVLGGLAALQLIAYSRIYAAEKFVELQKEGK